MLTNLKSQLLRCSFKMAAWNHSRNILVPHSGAAETSSLLGCDSVSVGEWLPTFRTIVVRNCRTATTKHDMNYLFCEHLAISAHIAYCNVCMSRDIPWLAERYAIVRRKVHQHRHKSLNFPSNTPPVFPFNHFSLSMTAFHLIPCTNIVWNKSHTDVRLFGLTPYSLVQNYRRFKGAYWFHLQSRFQQQDTLKCR